MWRPCNICWHNLTIKQFWLTFDINSSFYYEHKTEYASYYAWTISISSWRTDVYIYSLIKKKLPLKGRQVQWFSYIQLAISYLTMPARWEGFLYRKPTWWKIFITFTGRLTIWQLDNHNIIIVIIIITCILRLLALHGLTGDLLVVVNSDGAL